MFFFFSLSLPFRPITSVFSSLSSAISISPSTLAETTISVHLDHHPSPSDGSTIPVQLDDSIENLHFFTDRAADATLNPITLPFTAGMQDYIAVLAESISRQCVLDPSQRPITQDRLLRWAFTSYARANMILEVGSAGNRRFCRR